MPFRIQNKNKQSGRTSRAAVTTKLPLKIYRIFEWSAWCEWAAPMLPMSPMPSTNGRADAVVCSRRVRGCVCMHSVTFEFQCMILSRSIVCCECHLPWSPLLSGGKRRRNVWNHKNMAATHTCRHVGWWAAAHIWLSLSLFFQSFDPKMWLLRSRVCCVCELCQRRCSLMYRLAFKITMRCVLCGVHAKRPRLPTICVFFFGSEPNQIVVVMACEKQKWVEKLALSKNKATVKSYAKERKKSNKMKRNGCQWKNTKIFAAREFWLDFRNIWDSMRDLVFS